MRIVHVCRTGWPCVGGLETVVHGLAAQQSARGDDVRVVTLARSLVDGRVLPPGTHEGVRYVRVRRVGPRRYPAAHGLRHVRKGADLVHVHGLDGLADTVVRSAGRAAVGLSTHGGYFHTPRMSWVKKVVLRTLTRSTLRRADGVWFTSQSDRDHLGAAGVAGEVIGNGLDLRRLLDTPRNTSGGLWVIPGRVVSHKGHARLLRAVAAMPAPSWPRRLVAVGAGDATQGQRLDLLAARLGLGQIWSRVGPVAKEEWVDWLSRCERACFPSRAEGFGLAVVEAQAAGAVVVASDIPAHRELIRKGRDGWLVRLDDSVTAARLLSSIDSDTGPEARAVARRWDWRERLTLFDRAYEQAISASRSGLGRA